jgi:protease IV
MRINSPGGSPVQAGIVYDEIKRLKALHNKKVYAVVEEMCASGAYYIAVSGRRHLHRQGQSLWARSAC